ncbi:MAG: hypothetical protein ACRDJN_08570 [Chloroflexota bacterium]
MVPARRRLYLRCDTLIPCAPAGGGTSEVVEDAAVLIQDERIAAAGRAADVPAPPDAEMLAYPG